MEAVVLTEKDVPGAFLVGDPSEYRLTELKRWLECHGQSKNVTLREAVEKVRACIALGIKVNPGVDNGYFLCSDHFEDSHFMNVSEKKKLIWSAVPFIFKVPNPLPSVTSSRLPRTKDLIPEQQHPARREPT
ncbi:hypothetical protein C0Q70_18767 [Pomacea canaliculata]|uniref:Uncharacterized protein n=1 Tax=Pomacea canaliculata TaxID=400727 RepID=A0A2T7NHG0_POMCA|nr:hypothetical protein C0Q70_18767 [Pomacea canaliculata]